MAEYDKFIDLAKSLLTKKGRKITLQQLGTTANDPSRPWNGSAYQDIAMQYNDVPAAFVPVIGKDLGVIVTDYDLLKRSKQVAIVAAIVEGIENKVDRIVDTDGSTWKVVWGQCLRPGTQTIFYVFGVAR